jgi:hypothetical protein
VVGALVLFHLVANSVTMIPDPSQGLDRRAWKDPRAQRELKTWAERLGVQQAPLEEFLFDAGKKYQDARNVFVAPFKPYMQTTGLRQSWAMFGAGTKQRDRFQVRARACPVDDDTCAWRDLYVHGTDEHSWRIEWLAHPRARSGIFRWGWPTHKKTYARGCRAIARRAFDDFPELTAVQCRFFAELAPSPRDAAPAPPGRYDREVTVLRADLPTLPVSP